jgi:predicted dehydrogenase
MDAVRWGLLSTASINDAVLAGVAGSELVEIVAVASRDEDRARGYAQDRGIPRAHGGYDSLLADPEVEAVYNSLPNSLHVDWSVRALEAGKHVLVEKPFDRRAADVERAFDVAEAGGLILMEAFMYRHHPQTRKLAELVRGGAIGELRAVRAAFNGRLASEDDVRLLPELNGGALMDVGSYCVNGSRLLAGEPERVQGAQVVGPTGIDMRFAGLLVFANGVLGHFDCGFDLAPTSWLEAIGSERTAAVRDPWMCRDLGIELRSDLEVEQVAVADVDRYRAEFENMSLAIRGRAEPLLGRADAVGQARTIEALYRAAESGEAVTVSSG